MFHVSKIWLKGNYLFSEARSRVTLMRPQTKRRPQLQIANKHCSQIKV